MSQDFQNGRPKLKFRFWPVLHITMGLFFVVIGIVAATMHSFGAIQLAQGSAYAFGGLLVAYGIFRIWRGIHILRTPDDADE